LIPGQINVNVLQVVDARPADGNPVVGHVVPCWAGCGRPKPDILSTQLPTHTEPRRRHGDLGELWVNLGGRCNRDSGALPRRSPRSPCLLRGLRVC
jgi:hypothetical protein